MREASDEDEMKMGSKVCWMLKGKRRIDFGFRFISEAQFRMLLGGKVRCGSRRFTQGDLLKLDLQKVGCGGKLGDAPCKQRQGCEVADNLQKRSIN